MMMKIDQMMVKQRVAFVSDAERGGKEGFVSSERKWRA